MQEYRRVIGVSQQQIARELGLNPTVLSHKLHETDGMRLTHAEVKAIVMLLAAQQAFTRRSDVAQLLGLVNLKSNAFDDSEWASPPLNTLENDDAAPPSAPELSLPAPVTPLIGRAALVTSLLEQLSDPGVRLLTLAGVGGVGKTRVALELARLSQDRYADGVVFVALAGIGDAALVASEIAAQLQIKGSRSEAALVNAVKDALASKEMLLVLDNFEQVITAAPLVAELLEAAARLTILVTSREVLNLYGEHQVRVPPLELPDLQQDPDAPDRLLDQPAVALFVARSQAARRDFALTESNAHTIAEICVRLDGLPLALELAAARSRLFSPAALLQRLDQPLALLSGGAANAPSRQRTLRDTIGWSYALLDPAEQRVFRTISAFPGGCSVEALEVVLEPSSGTRPLIDLLTSLLDKNLIDQRELPGDELPDGELPDGDIRFTMLETLREFGVDLLVELGEWDHLRERQARFYVDWLQAVAPNLTGSTQLQTAAQIEAEHDNLRAILTWAAPVHRAPAAELIGILAQFWNMRGYAAEGLRWATMALDGGDLPPMDEARKMITAKAFNSAGSLAFSVGDYERAETYLQRALGLRIEVEDSEGIASTYNNLGNLAWNRTDLRAARQYFEDAAQIAEEIDNRKLLASILNNLGTLMQSFNDLALAEQYLYRALEIWRSYGNKQSIANTLSNLGGVASARQDFDRAMTYFVESLTLQMEVGNRRNAGAVLANMGEVALSRANFDEAQRYFEQTWTLQREVDYLWGVGSATGDLGRVAYFQGDYGTAFARLQEALTIMQQLDDRLKQALMLEYLGSTALKLGDIASALSQFKQALHLYQELNDDKGIATTLACVAGAIVAQGEPARAVRLWGAAFRLLSDTGVDMLPADRLRFERELDVARAVLGSLTFDIAWQEGETISPGEILGGLI